MKALYKKHPACIESTTKITNAFWGSLKQWIKDRNIYVHGLYKRPEMYSQRLNDRRKLAEDGVEMARLLYNEAKRIRRIEHNHPEKLIFDEDHCNGGKCF